jgi:hypothetical protein
MSAARRGAAYTVSTRGAARSGACSTRYRRWVRDRGELLRSNEVASTPRWFLSQPLFETGGDRFMGEHVASIDFCKALVDFADEPVVTVDDPLDRVPATASALAAALVGDTRELLPDQVTGSLPCGQCTGGSWRLTALDSARICKGAPRHVEWDPAPTSSNALAVDLAHRPSKPNHR